MPEKQKKKDRNQRVRPDEVEFIRQNCLKLSDERIAEILDRDMHTIITWRKKLGIIKGARGNVENIQMVESSVKDANAKSGIDLTESQREEFYKTQFVSTLYYKNLKKQFTEEELDFYIAEWGNLCLQFEDIVATEKRQIDEYIKVSIQDNRLLRNIHVIEQEIGLLQKEIEEFRAKNPTIEDDQLLHEASRRT